MPSLATNFGIRPTRYRVQCLRSSQGFCLLIWPLAVGVASLGCVDRPPPGGVRPSAARAKFSEEFELDEAMLKAAQQRDAAPRQAPFDANRVLIEGTGRQWVKLKVDQKLDIAELMHFETGKHSQLIYYRFLDDYYANPAMLDRKLSDFALITSAVPLFEDESTLTMIEEARKREAELAAKKPPAKKVQYRLWTSPDGRTGIEAAYIKAVGTIVFLKRRSDGREIRVQLTELSDVDQAYVRKQQAAVERLQSQKLK